MGTHSEITSFKNASLGNDVGILNNIHSDHINISIYQRNLQKAQKEILHFLNQDVHIKVNGSPEKIIPTVKEHLNKQESSHNYLFNDFLNLLKTFEALTQATCFRVLFSTIKTDMCRRFHTDVNNLRLLCTYYGPATLWLPEEAANRDAHHFGEDNEQIIKNPKLIQQANTGDVLILKGALYPDAKAIIHKSPSIEESRKKRLLLRIDMNKPLNFS